MPNLFLRIKKGKFFMPNYISDEAKDLINKMLQPLPLKRIKISEIKDHPWFKEDIPFYLQDLMSTKSLQKIQRVRKHDSSIPDDFDIDLLEQLYEVRPLL
jgi:serine/threonine protein kinase